MKLINEQDIERMMKEYNVTEDQVVEIAFVSNLDANKTELALRMIKGMKPQK